LAQVCLTSFGLLVFEMIMLVGMLPLAVVFADFHPGRSIVRDHQRKPAAQLPMRSTGTDNTSEIPLASLTEHASQQEGKKKAGERRKLLNGRTSTKDAIGQYEGHEDYRKTINGKSDQHFDVADEALLKLEKRLPELCPLDQCANDQVDAFEIQKKLVPCCKADPVVHLEILRKALVTITEAEKKVLEPFCQDETKSLSAVWGKAKEEFAGMKSLEPPYTGPAGGGHPPPPSDELVERGLEGPVANDVVRPVEGGQVGVDAEDSGSLENRLDGDEQTDGDEEEDDGENEEGSQNLLSSTF